MRFLNHYRTIVLSDIPLGSSPEYFKKMIYFIKNTSCDKLIFCGDIAKGWQLEKTDEVHKLYNKFIKVLLKVAERDNTQVIFLTGKDANHKGEPEALKFSNITFTSQYTFTSAGNTFHVIAGDLYNHLYNDTLPLYSMKKIKYNFLVWLNKKYNFYRISHGKEYLSLLKRFNTLLDLQTNIYEIASEYKMHLMQIAAQKEEFGIRCEGIVCGHTNYSGIIQLGNISFLSVGYWTETLTALAESNYGEWKVISYEKILKEKLEANKYADIMEEMFREHGASNVPSMRELI